MQARGQLMAISAAVIALALGGPGRPAQAAVISLEGLSSVIDSATKLFSQVPDAVIGAMETVPRVQRRAEALKARDTLRDFSRSLSELDGMQGGSLDTIIQRYYDAPTKANWNEVSGRFADIMLRIMIAKQTLASQGHTDLVLQPEFHDLNNVLQSKGEIVQSWSQAPPPRTAKAKRELKRDMENIRNLHHALEVAIDKMNVYIQSIT